jgi:hypothetical protein
MSAGEQSLILAARELDETPIVEQSKANADWVIEHEAQGELK